MGEPLNRRLIFVAGTPSGGTSCVAGVLHHLGVDMGRFMDRPGIRGYTTYEDTTANDFKDEHGQLRVSEYVAHRIATAHPHAGKHGLAGFKHTPLWVDTADASLPLAVVHVRRPLEDAIRSDAAIMRRLAETRPGYPTTPAELRARAGTIARAWEAARQIAEAYPLLATVDFPAMRAERQLHVTALAAALGLPTEGARFRAAVGGVKP